MDSSELIQSARRYAGRALDDHSNGDHDMALLNAGVMLEHLAKSLLCGHHPSLIVEGRSFDSLLIANKLAHLAKSNGVRTIGLEEACQRVSQVLKSFPKPELLRRVADARNGVAHVAAWNPLTVREVIVLAISAAHTILAELSIAPADFWADHHATVTALLDAQSAATQQSATMKLATAKRRYDHSGATPTLVSLWNTMPPSMDIVTAVTGPAGHIDIPCPACGNRATSVGYGDIDLEFDDDRENGPHVIGALIRWCPDEISCVLCGLALDGFELRSLGLHEIILREPTQEELDDYFRATTEMAEDLYDGPPY